MVAVSRLSSRLHFSFDSTITFHKRIERTDSVANKGQSFLLWQSRAIKGNHFSLGNQGQSRAIKGNHFSFGNQGQSRAIKGNHFSFSSTTRPAIKGRRGTQRHAEALSGTLEGSSKALSGGRTSCCTTIPGPARRCTIFFSLGHAPHSAHRGRWALPLQLRQTTRRLTVASFSLPLYLREAIDRSSNAIKRQSEVISGLST